MLTERCLEYTERHISRTIIIIRRSFTSHREIQALKLLRQDMQQLESVYAGISGSLLTEILSLKQLRRKYYLRSGICRSPYKLCCFFNIFFYVTAAAHLDCSNCNLSHTISPHLSHSAVSQWAFTKPQCNGERFQPIKITVVSAV